MKILGIDPGYAILGYGVIEKTGNRFRVCSYGSITTEASMAMEDRLEHLYDSLREIIDEERPEVAAIEQLFFQHQRQDSDNGGTGQGRGSAGLQERRTRDRRVYAAADKAGAGGIRQSR